MKFYSYVLKMQRFKQFAKFSVNFLDKFTIDVKWKVVFPNIVKALTVMFGKGKVQTPFKVYSARIFYFALLQLRSKWFLS